MEVTGRTKAEAAMSVGFGAEASGWEVLVVIPFVCAMVVFGAAVDG